MSQLKPQKLTYLTYIFLTILFYHAFFSFFYNLLIFLVPVVIAQIFIPTAELLIPTGMATNKANVEIETQPVAVKAKISQCST